ncbi:MAG: sulfate ABC transporter substrate-binding protein, partial [Actinobacteria bacterium]
MNISKTKLLPVVPVLAALALGLAACGSSSSGGNKLALVAYSTPKEAYADIIPAFDRTAGGKGVTFSQSYGASGDQSRAVAAGLPADVVAFSLAPDVNKLVDKGLVAPGWDQDAYHGMVTDSVVVLAVRKGNPKH